MILSLPSGKDAPTLPLGLFTHHADIGPVKSPGSASYDAATQQYTLNASGTNMWADRDEFHMAWRVMRGDFILRARIGFVGKGVDPHRKAGLIIRTSLDASSAYADAAVHGDGLTALQYRPTAGAVTANVAEAKTRLPDVVQLERQGTRLTMSVGHFGEPLSETQAIDLDLPDQVYAGLFLTSHNPNVSETAIFSNVRIVVPAGKDLVPYRDYLGSHLEILNTQTGLTRIIYSSPDCLEAPNWTPDGRSLIYNSKGRLYRIDLASGQVTPIDTGFANRNNNDHVLSFDGRMLGISHHHQELGGSCVYVLPTGGGTPRQVTTKAPSYLHGWSPDCRTLLYTGERGDANYDIYSIGVEGGQETRLTTTPGLDDGSEFAPDGRTIYFNSVRSGRMQIWRMNPDGSDQRQVTDDQWNNWFAHVSPDGKQIVILSYGQDVPASSHPYYKHVLLRQMPVVGGTPRVVAYLYGGQGTINVPSWSPDSRHLAYVSHSGALP
jgi:Tol biopolymer transport system component